MHKSKGHDTTSIGSEPHPFTIIHSSRHLPITTNLLPQIHLLDPLLSRIHLNINITLPQRLEDPLPLIPQLPPPRLLALQLRLLRLRHGRHVDFLQLEQAIFKAGFLGEKSLDGGFEVFGGCGGGEKGELGFQGFFGGFCFGDPFAEGGGLGF